ncbi:TonB-dependent receptor [Chitinophaga sp. 212800010-3]|uniref:TonB-dependent receptor n=1 Tax=unclassified Chitinophaga TaxID=2619133 RepID=UPI002E0E91CB
MKFLAILLLCFATQSTAMLYSQDVKITLKAEHLPLKKFFKLVESKCNYRIAYSSNLLTNGTAVNIDVVEQPLQQVLQTALANTRLTFQIMNDNLVVIRMRDSAAVQSRDLIKGTVKNVRGEPVAGATVLAGKKVSITDGSGHYEIAAAPGDLLVFTFIGYEKQEIRVGSQSTVDVIFEEKKGALNEVIVVGYGAQRKKDLTGAVSTVSAKDLEDRPATNFGYSMEGKAAGVQVVRSSGKPQGGFSIRVRGTTSITADSEPLYVVDGVPSATTFDINPNDIENITILKDASSAAIYGAAGANGVVLITTKRGKKQVPQIAFNTYAGSSKVTKKLPVLNRQEYIDLMTQLGQVADWSKYTANTNWHDEVFRNAASQSYQVSLTGGNDATTYYLSGAWLKQDGVVRTNTMNRYNFKINLDQKVGKFVKVGTSIAYSKWFDRNVDDNRGSGNGGVIMNVLTMSPVVGIYNPDGTFTANPLRLSFHNPVAYTDGSTNGYNNSRFFGNIYGEVQLLPSLKFKSLFGYDHTTGKYNYFLDPYKTDWGRVNKGIADLNMDENVYWLSENTLTFSKKFHKHHLEALAGFSTSKTSSESSQIETKNFSGISVPTVGGGAVINKATGARSARSNDAFISRINYSYADKYLFTGNFRADASSVFGPGNRTGYFPSFSLGWRISEEPFFKSVRNIDELKLRFGWGKVGNDHIVPYAWYGQVGTNNNYVMGGGVQPGTAPITPENRDLRWETTTQHNIGIDIAILKSRIIFSADAYLKHTHDLLFDKPLATSSGFTSALQNIGKLENKGLEFTVSTKNLTGPFSWNTDLNFSLNRNKVIDIGHEILPIGALPQREETSTIREGLPLGTFWGYVATGVDPKTGMMTYADLDKSGDVSDGDKTVIGNANPRFTYGLTNTLSYKGWNLSVFLQGVQGNDIFNGTRIEIEGMNDYRNQSTAVLRRWTKEGQVTDIPKAVPDDVSNSRISSRFVENGSYLRLKAVTLSYRLPDQVTKRCRINGASIYVTGENLLTATRYSGYDPEVSAFGGQNGAIGIDFGTYPQTRQVIAGLNVSF